MKHKTFFWFILPSLAAMILFIALPIVSVVVQSLFIEHEQVLVTVENCGPFGCTEETRVDREATAALREEQPLGRFNGLGTYFDRGHLATQELAAAWAEAESLGQFWGQVMNLPFYRALVFTLAYTFIVTPFVLVLGLAIALGVNGLPRVFRGPTIFFSLLPMIVGKQAAEAAGAFDAIYTDPDGTVTEGTVFSIVWRRNEKLITAPAESVLPGTAQTLLIERAHAAGYTAQEERFSVADLQAADEVMITNSLFGCLPVQSIDGVAIAQCPGECFARCGKALFAV